MTPLFRLRRSRIRCVIHYRGTIGLLYLSLFGDATLDATPHRDYPHDSGQVCLCPDDLARIFVVSTMFFLMRLSPPSPPEHAAA